MAQSIEWPRRPPPRSGRSFIWILVVIAVIAFGGRTALSYYVDELWFSSLGYGAVFWKTQGLQWAVVRDFWRSHVLHSVRIVSGFEAGVPRCPAKQPHDSRRRTAGAVAGRLCPAHHRARRRACHRRFDWHRDDGGVADAGSLLVRAARRLAAWLIRSSASR